MESVFTVLAVLLLLQSLAALAAGLRLARYVWRTLSTPRERYVPKAAVIIPCKGLEPDFEENIIAYLAQDYRHYELVFVTETENDPAYFALKRILQDSNRSAWLITAGESRNRGQKVHNLCAALDTLDAVDRNTEVLVFADADARPEATWLSELVAPLSDPRIGATTGFRWYLPVRAAMQRMGLSRHVLSAWNAAALNILGERSSFAWGGATAINRDIFESLRIKQQWESGAVSDDYVLTKAVRGAHLRIKFVPQCLMLSEARMSWQDVLEFTTRQMVITRVYAPRVWWLAAITHMFFNVTFWGGIAMLAIGQTGIKTILPLLIGSFMLGLMTGATRWFLATHLLPEEVRSIVRKGWWAYWFLHPVISLLYLYNVIASAQTRRIVWRGIGYEMRSPSETVIWQRPPAPQKIAQAQHTHSGAPAKSPSLDS
ncbi:MAG: glycosyltransferase family 2 protein [Acidobacteria bacterium]|nr:glycosyltransferase family 2 protein [Acidobacteriota bacterium]